MGSTSSQFVTWEQLDAVPEYAGDNVHDKIDWIVRNAERSGQMYTSLSRGGDKRSDVKMGRVVGQNNFTGNYLVDNNRQINTVRKTENHLQKDESVSLGRDNRNVIVLGPGSGRVVTFIPKSKTSNKANPDDLDICNTPSGGSPSNSEPPKEPEGPENPKPPAEPEPPAPEDPEEPDTPPSPSEGCYPESDCQWYNAPSGNPLNCPSGTTYKGFAELPGIGNFMVLCCGEERPAGDGCPDDPVAYGWQCVNGTCEQLPAGLYATKAECETNCNQEPCGNAWASEGGTCTFVGCGQGEYGTEDECIADQEFEFGFVEITGTANRNTFFRWNFGGLFPEWVAAQEIYLNDLNAYGHKNAQACITEPDEEEGGGRDLYSVETATFTWSVSFTGKLLKIPPATTTASGSSTVRPIVYYEDSGGNLQSTTGNSNMNGRSNNHTAWMCGSAIDSIQIDGAPQDLNKFYGN
jgi:hypothetical protein